MNRSASTGAPSRAIRSVSDGQVRRGVPADVETERAQEDVDHAGHRRLAVGAGHEDHGVGTLRRPEEVEQVGDPLQGGLDPRLRPTGRERLLHQGEPLGRVVARGVRAARTYVVCGHLPRLEHAAAAPRQRIPVRVRRPGLRTITGHGATPDPQPCPREADDRRARGALGAGMGERGHLPLRPDEDARADLLHRHAAAHRERFPPRRPRVQLHPHRHHRAVPADAWPRGLLPDGLGRQRAAHRAPGAELLRCAVRSLVAVRPGLRPAGRAGQAADPGQPGQLRRALPRSDRRGREGLRGPVAPLGPVGRLDPDVPDDRLDLTDRSPARLPPQPGPRRGLPPRGSDPVGRHVPHGRRAGRARGPRANGRLPPDRVPSQRRCRLRVDRDDAP